MGKEKTLFSFMKGRNPAPKSENSATHSIVNGREHKDVNNDPHEEKVTATSHVTQIPRTSITVMANTTMKESSNDETFQSTSIMPMNNQTTTKQEMYGLQKSLLGKRTASNLIPEIEKPSKYKLTASNQYIMFKDGKGYKDYAKKICKDTRFDYTKFDPSASIYDDEEKDLLASGDIPYLFLASALDAVGEVPSRIEKTQRMANCFRAIIHHSRQPYEDLLAAVYLCINKLGSDYQGVELGIGEAILMKALGESMGRSLASIKKIHERLGDLGLIAQQARGKQGTLMKAKCLSIRSVFATFRKIALRSGKNSQQEKVNHIKHLLSSSRDCEPQYIIRSLQGKMRVGLGDETVPISLAHAFVLSGIDERISVLKEAEEIMKRTYAQHPVYDDIIKAFFESGLSELEEKCPLTPGIPVLPMLAKPTKTVQEVFQRLVNSFTLEWKYDGERAQIHILEDGKIEIYSRRMERHTAKFPDLIAMLPSAMNDGVHSAILDCEVVAYDRTTNRIEPFQLLTTRARKDVDMENIKVTVCLFAFDLLYLNGESYLKKTLRERREKLFSSFHEIDDQFKFVTHKDTNDEVEIQKYLEESVSGNCEGLMVKSLDINATYEPSRRSFNWLKMKKDYIQGLGDSLDLVPIGAYYGTGKRTGVYGGYLLAVYDPHTEELQSICKIGTGFSEQQLKDFHSRLSKNVIPRPHGSYQVGSLGKDIPNVWLEPTEVWEVQCADFSLSPIYKAAVGLIDENKGIALRFPRFIRVRDDKSIEDATSSEQVADMYSSQAIIANRTNLNSKPLD